MKKKETNGLRWLEEEVSELLFSETRKKVDVFVNNFEQDTQRKKKIILQARKPDLQYIHLIKQQKKYFPNDGSSDNINSCSPSRIFSG